MIDNIVNYACFVNLDNLMQVLHFLAMYMTDGTLKINIDEQNYLETAFDLDLLHIFKSLNLAIRGRVKNKVINFAYQDCVCHLKCNGMVGNYPFVEQEIIKIRNIVGSTQVCGCCRLSHNIKNTTSVKPRKLIYANTSTISTCSQDGCAVTFLLRYFFVDMISKSKFRYEHFFLYHKFSCNNRCCF